MTKEKKPSTVNRFNIVFINIQFILTIITVILGVWYLFRPSLLLPFQFLLGIDLLVMAYNNQIIYHRKNATIMYIMIGILLLVLALFKLIGG